MTDPTFRFGPEYPAILNHIDGARMPLVHERRWSRVFQHPSTRAFYRIPRFMDGSASLKADDLRKEWANWSLAERQDFCQSMAGLRSQADFPEMLRFLATDGTADTWSAIAVAIATVLPQEEAFQMLRHALATMDAAAVANVIQALAITKHPSASSVIQNRLQVILGSPNTWIDDRPYNTLASTAVAGIKYLVELGVDAGSFESAVRLLAEHPAPRNRTICKERLGPYYAWLEDIREVPETS